MSTQPTHHSPGFLPVLVASLGVVLMGYGALTFVSSLLGGAWLAASGLFLLLSQLIRTGLVGGRFGLTPGQQRAASHTLGVVGVVLLALFVVVNYAAITSFETVEVSG